MRPRALRRRLALIGFGGMLICGLATAGLAKADQSPEDVRVQEYRTEYARCLVFTHDTAQGASIAVWCK